MGAVIASKIIAWGGRFLSNQFAMYDKENMAVMFCDCVTMGMC